MQSYEARRGRTDRLWFINPLILSAVLLPYQWMTLATVGGFKFQLAYLGTLIALLTGVLAPRVLTAQLFMFRHCAVWLVPYIVFLLVSWINLQGSTAENAPVRQGIFLLFFIGAGGWLLATREKIKVMRLAGAGAIIGFLLVSEWIAWSIGTSWLEATKRFFLYGDLNYIVYDFLRSIFNAGLDESSELIAASNKNVTAGSLVVALCLFRMGRPVDQPDRLGALVTFFMVFLLLIINTRSIVVAFGLGLIFVGYLNLMRARKFSLFGSLVALTFAAGVFLATIMLLAGDNPLGTVLGQRFAFNDASTEGRLAQYAWALREAETNLLFGPGYAELNEQTVHNIFLAALLYGGVPMLLLVMFFYVVLTYRWLSLVLMILRRPNEWVLPLRPEWVALLPVAPLFRMWIAGGSGLPPVDAWIALSVFFALTASNSMQRQLRERSAGGRAGRGGSVRPLARKGVRLHRGQA